MKKVDSKFLLAQLGIILVISAILGVIMGVQSVDFMSGFTAVTILAFIFLCIIWFLCVGSMVTDKLAGKTMEQKSREMNFSDCSTFYSSNAIIRIDEENGRIAYVAKQNPFEFQVISAGDLTDIKSEYKKEILGGTRYVYFQFTYQGKVVRIPTFYSRQTYSLKSSDVMEAISKADTYRDIILNAKNNSKGH